jgi:type I restriction enzyme S subunit
VDTVLLGDVADITSGFAMRPTDDGLPQLRMTSITNDGTMDISGVKLVNPSEQQKKKYRLQRGDIIFTNTNSEQYVGKTALFDDDGEYYFSNHLTRVRLHDKRLHAGYVARYLHHLWMTGRYESLITRWVNQAAMQSDKIEGIAVPLLPADEQHRIADRLDEADGLQRLRKEANERAQRILPALFVEMFGDPETNPMGWDLKTLGEVTSGKPKYGAGASAIPWTSGRPR